MPNVAQYLAKRLLQLGVEHLFCIPGNYSAEFLLAAELEKIKCVGTTNELEAGYAADAYARYRGIGACSVTYGVGSQSLYNAIAGSYVEFCPVVLINGSPPLSKVDKLKHNNILFAHAIDPLRTDRLIFEPVTVAQAEITSADDAPAEIDRVLRACITQHRPVYLEVHQGVWYEECDGSTGELVLSPPTPEELIDQDVATAAVVKEVLQLLKEAKHPVLWGGEMVQRLGAEGLFRSLVGISALPYTTTLMGKGLIGESEFPKQFIGVYDSTFARSDITRVVEQSDCLIAIGTILSDFYANIAVNSADRLVLATRNSVTINRRVFTQVPLEGFLAGLIANWHQRRTLHETLPGLSTLVEKRSLRVASFKSTRSAEAAKQTPIPLTWDNFFERLGNLINDQMIVLTDTSLALFPSAELPINRPGGYVAQTAWLSIGYTGGATLGVALAEPDIRAVAIAGDGGFQMVPQAFSTLVRQDKAAIVFVMDNGLYGIEQFLIDEQILPKGQQFYRDKLPEPSSFDVLPRWNYEKLATAFGGRGFAVSTMSELDAAWKEVLALKDVPALIAVQLAPHDLPRGISAVVHPQKSARAAESAAVPAADPSPKFEVSFGSFN
jgi:indolepyruvate decarboxylase